ncbi:MAG: serine/threonine protein kinase [Piscinibacter sp.]|uniref:serine/threonine-protein kinase n=1 Tax=Piscinibacter sp. TaxID=1903157 RepID=UPI002583C317|nr:serine/threonine-protein kinase [Piscinibacter sp.]MCW5664150.1 serine/threonine protein kinase [Piscinibacter sp.]
MVALHALTHRWPALSALLDEALALPPGERPRWLEALKVDAALRDTLRTLLADYAEVEHGPFLATLPRLDAAPGAGAGPAPGARIGPYRLIAELGRGGMGTVWLAERADGAFERRVALKLPLVHRLRPELAARFLRERDILARLEHPHIARLYDAGLDADGLPYLALELVEGEPIDAHADARRLGLRARLALFVQVLEALQYAHANLVIHRDLKPSNILVDAAGQVRLLDFGIAKLLAGPDAPETELTRVSGRPLTPEYASPEQVRGEPLGTASDLYSLGVVLHRLLAGAAPYRVDLRSAAQWEQAVLGAEPVRPSEAIDERAAAQRGGTRKALARALAGDLDTIVLKALAKAPAERYPTADAFADDLRRHLDGRPVQARPAAWTYRLRRAVRRNRLAVGAAGAVAAALLAGSAAALWQARIAAEEARSARAQGARAEEVKRFVVSIFEDASPYGGAGRAVTAVELLRQARARLEATPVRDAATQVELRTTIGNSLRAVGDYPSSFEVLREAAALATRQLGPLEPARLDAQLALGWSAVLLGELAAAQAALDDAERGRRARGESAALSKVLIAQSELVKDRGDTTRALALAEQALQEAEAHAARTGDTLPVIDALVALCNRLRGLGRPGMLAQAQRARALALAAFGDRPTDQALDARRVHASAQIAEGDRAAGVAEMRAIVRERTRLSGEGHHAVAVALREIGTALLLAGDPSGAAAEWQEALRLTRAQSDGRPNPEIANTAYNLGVVLAAARRPADALVQFRAAAAMHRELASPQHPVALLARCGEADMLLALGRVDAAEAVLDALAPQLGDDAHVRAVYRWRLGQLRSAQGRHAQALELLSATAAHFDGGSPRHASASRHSLGRALLAAGRAHDAHEALNIARARLEPEQPDGSPDLADIAADIARARQAMTAAAPPAPVR